MFRASAVLVDNGEPNLLQCILSLRSQTIPVEIVLCPGPKTDVSKVAGLVDKVCEPKAGIGRARVEGILEASSCNIICADSDCVYDSRYAELAVRNLESGAKVVKAGTILPLKWEPLAAIESAASLLIPYEFALAFNRCEVLKVGLVEEADRNGGDPRWDIGPFMLMRFIPAIDHRMIVYTRFPSKGAQKFTKDYLPPLVAGSAPLILLAGLMGARML
jgi:glycosyltransferase involved in cell wall biosynthesis